MIKDIREQLIKIARDGSKWSYTQLNEQLRLGLDFTIPNDRDTIGTWLGEVSWHEHDRGRPLLSSLIIHKGHSQEQGDGFYKMCEEMFAEDWKTLKANPDFEKKLMDECYSFWKNDINYKAFKNDY